ncbi:PIG-L family deacetylase [Pseudomonas sp. PDM18]|uniref:PIG-L deacetylase family protein n=1 Tax=unclassified Pseudomonas TaxID=196821 RepID=UPI001785D997|nr:PIG-L family deacetylase [Pseudomonas sp. PDM18]MBD9678971.1 PIG-L family deacetylase [Pseudomonas sp. PDM18]
MSARKQHLLKQHRRKKRATLLVALLAVILLGIFAPWWSVPLAVLLGWVAHEAWFADHLFYSPRDDYRYDFPEGSIALPVSLGPHGLHVATDALPENEETLVLEIEVKASLLGRWLDPQVLVEGVEPDRQDFERGVSGKRYINLSGQGEALRSGQLRIRSRHCRLAQQGVLHAFHNPDYTRQRLLIVAPHADDAELAAFGQYSRCPDAWIVTLTQGEIEAEHYQRLGLDKAAAAHLKGRLRTWDSIAAPLWGGVPTDHCVQLGYYCLQLPAMAADPSQAFGSRESGDIDIRSARGLNPFPLPGDSDGAPTWLNLVADLTALIERIRPEVVLTAHPELDPHADHVHATQATLEAMSRSSWKPQTLLLYANHLHDNDRWPMGPADGGIALPPCIEALPADPLWSPVLDAATRVDKALALALQHDLQTPLTGKKRLRRLIQRVLAGRQWPVTGDDEFFRKAVRRHELFWVRKVP